MNNNIEKRSTSNAKKVCDERRRFFSKEKRWTDKRDANIECNVER